MDPSLYYIKYCAINVVLKERQNYSYRFWTGAGVGPAHRCRLRSPIFGYYVGYPFLFPRLFFGYLRGNTGPNTWLPTILISHDTPASVVKL
jgi:hypothetical protein